MIGQKLNQSHPKVVLEYEIKALLGEGAIWNYKTHELLWVDIEGKTLNRYDAKNKKNNSVKVPSRIGTVVPVNSTEAVVALEDGIYLIDVASGKIGQISNIESDKVNNRFNDGKCDPNGNLWVGSMVMKKSNYTAALYKVEGNGKTTKMLDGIKISNGIVWTSDKKTMYYIDTPTHKIMAYDFDSKNSTISNGRVAVEVNTQIGYPDGMAIDEEGMLWVGLWNGNAVGRFNPQTGKLIQKIEVPAHNVTACAFGGKNLEILYITTASVDMTDEEQKKYPLAGSLFSVKPGVKGVKSHFFKKHK